MTKKDDQAPINNPEEPKEQQQEALQSKAATAIQEQPKSNPKSNPKKWEPGDDDRVTVLHGWGRVPAGDKHFVDKVLFIDGVARDIPYAFAKYWQKGTRPDGKQDQVYGKVNIHVLPSNATEADFCEATGITPMPVEKFAAQLAGVDLNELAAQLGTERLKKLVDGLDVHLPKHMQRG